MSYRAWMLALLAVLVLAAPAAADITAGNLIQNPGAESQTMAPWAGTVSPITYGFQDYPSRAIADQYTGGCYFFSAGGASTNAAASQTVDLSGVSEITGGNVVATLSGYLGGFGAQDDNARVQVDFFKTGGGTAVGNPIVIGPVTAADR